MFFQKSMIHWIILNVFINSILFFSKVNFPEKERPKNKIKIGLYQIKTIFKLVLNIGFMRNTRKKFWFYLISIAYQNPKGLLSFIRKSAFIEYCFEYSQLVKNEIQNELRWFPKINLPESSSPLEGLAVRFRDNETTTTARIPPLGPPWGLGP